MEIAVDIPERLINDMLISAFEGGCNYWIDHIVLIDNKGQETGSLTDEPLDNLSRITIVEGEEGENKRHTLRISSAFYAQIKGGLTKMAAQYPRHFANALSGDHDAETADVFVQCCIFGETKYG